MSSASPTCCSKFTSNVTSLGVDKSARGSQREDPFSVLHEKLRQEPLLSQASPNLFDVGLLAQNHGGKLRHRHLLFSYSHCHSLPPPDNNNSVVLDPMMEAAHRTRTLQVYLFLQSLQGGDTILPQRKRCPYLGPNIFPFLSWIADVACMFGLWNP